MLPARGVTPFGAARPAYRGDVIDASLHNVTPAAFPELTSIYPRPCRNANLPTAAANTGLGGPGSSRGCRADPDHTSETVGRATQVLAVGRMGWPWTVWRYTVESGGVVRSSTGARRRPLQGASFVLQCCCCIRHVQTFPLAVSRSGAPRVRSSEE